jgi:hypothetical protein
MSFKTPVRINFMQVQHYPKDYFVIPVFCSVFILCSWDKNFRISIFNCYAKLGDPVAYLSFAHSWILELWPYVALNADKLKLRNTGVLLSSWKQRSLRNSVVLLSFYWSVALPIENSLCVVGIRQWISGRGFVDCRGLVMYVSSRLF